MKYDIPLQLKFVKMRPILSLSNFLKLLTGLICLKHPLTTYQWNSFLVLNKTIECGISNITKKGATGCTQSRGRGV